MKLKSLLLATSLAFAASHAQAQEITVWDWKSGDPVTQGYFASAKDAFEKAHPGATVKFVVQPHDQYYTLLGTALSSGQAPDVVLLHGGAQTTSRAAALKDLTSMTDGFSGLEAFSAEGKTYALPLTIQGFVIYYNKKHYIEAGLDANAAPKSYDDLIKVCEAIKVKGTTSCFAMGNKEGFGGEFMATLATANTFTAEDTTAWIAGKLPWTDPKVRAIIDLWVDGQSRGWYPKGANSLAKFMDEYEGFMRGEGVHTVGLLSDVAHWKQFGEILGAENIGAFAFPTPGASVAKLPFAGGIGWAVTLTTDQPDLSLDLVKLLTDPDREAVFALDTGALPANNKVDTSRLSSPSLTTILGLMSSVPAGMPHAVLKPPVLEEWKRQSQLLLNGETKVDDVIKAMEAARLANP